MLTDLLTPEFNGAASAGLLTLLSPKDLAQAIGTSESSMKRWIDAGKIEAVRTHGGHRRITMAEALQFIRRENYKILDPRPLGLLPLVQDQRPLSERLHELLTGPDPMRARSLLVSAFTAGTPIHALGDGPIREAMSRIGMLWQHGESGISIEHHATDACLLALQTIRLMLPEPPPSAPVAVGGAPSRDPYQMPSLLVAAGLHEAGFRTFNLGADSPLAAIKNSVERYRARIAWISISTQDALSGLRQGIYKLTDDLRTQDVRVLVGGRLVDALGLEPRQNLLIAHSMGEAVGMAKKILG